MTVIIQSYPFKLPQKVDLYQSIEYLKELCMDAGQQLLKQLWTEEWINNLQNKDEKAFSIIGEQQVSLNKEIHQIYLPSRIRRCIAERVGRILRSQGRRKACYDDVLRIVQTTGVEGNLDTLVKIVAFSLIQFQGKYYRWALIRQTLRKFRQYHYRLGLDLNVLTSIPYTKMVSPTIHSFNLPYSADDGQALKMEWQQDKLVMKVKLPRTKHPIKRKDWQWFDFTTPIPDKIFLRVNKPGSKLNRPTLRYITLKGGLIKPFLQVVWSIKYERFSILNQKRVMATDLGILNLTTSVICEAGSQISTPIFWSANNRLLHKIEKIYQHITNLQRKLDRYPEQWRGQEKRRQERERLYGKLNRYRKLIIHQTSNYLLKTALKWQCHTLVLEDLRAYEPPKNKRKLSRKLSNWLRGSLYEVLLYKAKRLNIKIRRVSARWTSSYCPRCGQLGQKIVDPSTKTVNKLGRYFSCSYCHYTADRDVIGSINIYRIYQEYQNKRFHLKFARPVSYMGAGIPRNRPRGTSVHFLVNG